MIKIILCLIGVFCITALAVAIIIGFGYLWAMIIYGLYLSITHPT